VGFTGEPGSGERTELSRVPVRSVAEAALVAAEARPEVPLVDAPVPVATPVLCASAGIASSARLPPTRIVVSLREDFIGRRNEG
jgi:hypothetical protein